MIKSCVRCSMEKTSCNSNPYQYIVTLRWKCTDGDMFWFDVDVYYFSSLSEARDFVKDTVDSDGFCYPICDLLGYDIGYVIERESESISSEEPW